jgi:heat shock protein HslJ
MPNHIPLTLFRRSQIFRLLSFFVAAAILLSACGTPTIVPTLPIQATASVDVNRLYNALWVLVAYGDPGNPTVVEQGLQITATFSPEGQVTGFAGCNNYNGTFTASTDGVLSIGPLATTRMACQQRMDVENAYLTAFQASQSFNFSNEGRLEIKYPNSSGKEQTMVFISGQATLTDNVWVLLSYGDPKSPQTVPGSSLLTAIFSTDERLSGFSGCNSYSASYKTTQDGQITFGPVASTKIECSVGMEGEQTYLEALSTVQSYQISGNSLTLTYNEGTEVLNFTSAKLPLENTLWTLAAVDGLPLPTETQITAMFTPGDVATSGTIGGSSGCNSYNAEYSLDGAPFQLYPPRLWRVRPVWIPNNPTCRVCKRLRLTKSLGTGFCLEPPPGRILSSPTAHRSPERCGC